MQRKIHILEIRRVECQVWLQKVKQVLIWTQERKTSTALQQACLWVYWSLHVFMHAPWKEASPADRQNRSLRRDVRIPFESVLPPDRDSNQTLTASCRADVWAGATFKSEDTERRGIDGGEITVKQLDTWETTWENTKEQKRIKSKELTRGLNGALGCVWRALYSPQRNNSDSEWQQAQHKIRHSEK